MEDEQNKAGVNGLLLVILGVNTINISPLGNPPGWNGTKPSSETVLEEKI